MKILILACVASLALLAVPGRCQEAAELAGTPAKVEKLVKAEEIVDVEDEESVDFARMLGDLLEYDHEEEEEEDKGEDDRDSRQLSNNDAPIRTGDVIEKYNKFVDLVLTRMSSNMKKSVDPMRITLRKSGKAVLKSDKNKNKKGGNKKGRRKGNKSGNASRNNRRRHPKDIGVEVPEGSAEEERSKRDLRYQEDEEVGDEDYEEYEDYEDEREGRLLDYEEDELEDEEYEDEREGKDLKMDYYDEYDEYDEEFEEEPEDAKTDVELSRGAKDLRKPSDGTEANKLPSDITDVTGRRRRGGPRRRRNNPRRRRRKGKCNRRCKRIRRVNRRKRKRNASKRRKNTRGKRSTNRPSAIVSGMSNVRRNGNVRITQKPNSQNIEADLMVGPIRMEAERSFGSGPNQSVRKAQAMASEVRGEIVFNVNKDGDAKIKKLRIFRPENIQVTGSLKKSGAQTSDDLVKNYISKARPLIARKMKNSARRVLRITSNQ